MRWGCLTVRADASGFGITLHFLIIALTARTGAPDRMKAVQ